jgi:hypothetical protein
MAGVFEWTCFCHHQKWNNGEWRLSHHRGKQARIDIFQKKDFELETKAMIYLRTSYKSTLAHAKENKEDKSERGGKRERRRGSEGMREGGRERETER